MTALLQDRMQRLASVLQMYRFRYDGEKALQDELEKIFTLREIPCRREVTLGDAGIIDFVLFDQIGVEVKIKGGRAPVLRQVFRYMPHVAGLVLVTTRLQLTLPNEVEGKPVLVVPLLGALR